MKEFRVKISHKDLIDLIRTGKTQNKFDLNVDEVKYDPETEEYVTTRVETQIDFIEVGE
jgi:hypothetical protein